uniref:Uncharacterized protein n=1 Tax=Setaria italica TaxID=4555 RepID=K4ALF1_SETIT
MAHISDIKLIRTDTTLDLSQKAEKAPMDSSSPPPSSSPAPSQAPARSRGATNASQRWSILRRSLLARSSSSLAPGPADSLPLSSPMSTFASASF